MIADTDGQSLLVVPLAYGGFGNKESWTRISTKTSDWVEAASFRDLYEAASGTDIYHGSAPPTF